MEGDFADFWRVVNRLSNLSEYCPLGKRRFCAFVGGWVPLEIWADETIFFCWFVGRGVRGIDAGRVLYDGRAGPDGFGRRRGSLGRGAPDTPGRPWGVE